MKKITTLYQCKSVGPNNNGLMTECNFQFAFETGFTPHCPLCGEALEVKPSENSVSKLMQQGMREERLKK